MRLRSRLAMCAAAAWAVGCGSPTAPGAPLSARARAFIASQPVPRPQAPTLSYADPARGVTVFTLPYGPPQDCPSGCIYDLALGLEAGDRVGWVEAPRDGGPFTTYDVQPTDTALFSAAFLGGLESARPLLYAPVAAMLACDAATPDALRRALAARVPLRDRPGCAPLP